MFQVSKNIYRLCLLGAMGPLFDDIKIYVEIDGKVHSVHPYQVLLPSGFLAIEDL
jgi:hypothetical protein